MSEDDLYLRPVWMDNEDEPLFDVKPQAKPETAKDLPLATVSKLIRAQDAIARLEAGLAAAQPDIAAGCRARLALYEAVGYVAHQGSTIHHRDLALRDVGMTGSYLAAFAGGRITQEARWSGVGHVDEPDLPEDLDIMIALAYAKQWQRLIEYISPPNLKAPGDFIEQLRLVGCSVGDAYTFVDWLNAVPTQHDKPGLMQLAWILSYGLPGRQREDKIDIAAAYVAAAFWRQTPYGRHCPLPFWSAPVRTLAVLGRQGGADFDLTFYECVTEAAMSGIRELTKLVMAVENLARSPKWDKPKVKEAAFFAIRHPIITSSHLAKHLDITAPSSNKMIEYLIEHGFLKEVTGRKAWRAFAVM